MLCFFDPSVCPGDPPPPICQPVCLHEGCDFRVQLRDRGIICVLCSDVVSVFKSVCMSGGG